MQELVAKDCSSKLASEIKNSFKRTIFNSFASTIQQLYTLSQFRLQLFDFYKYLRAAFYPSSLFPLRDYSAACSARYTTRNVLFFTLDKLAAMRSWFHLCRSARCNQFHLSIKLCNKHTRGYYEAISHHTYGYCESRDNMISRIVWHNNTISTFIILCDRDNLLNLSNKKNKNSEIIIITFFIELGIKIIHTNSLSL